jgi:hypothetical protein
MTQSGNDSRDDGRTGQNPPISSDLARLARERGWPAELTRRVAELRVPLSSLYSWTW